jgi:hypothetical protein
MLHAVSTPSQDQFASARSVRPTEINERESNQSALGAGKSEIPTKQCCHRQTRVDFPLGLYVSSPRNHVARQPARKVAVQLALPANPWRRRKGDGNQIIDQPAAGEIDGGGERT